MTNIWTGRRNQEMDFIKQDTLKSGTLLIKKLDENNKNINKLILCSLYKSPCG
jgi:hypothetical protein